MNSICFFSSYYNGENMPDYVKFYLTELTRHFSEVVFLTIEKAIPIEDAEFLQAKNIQYRLYKNEGFDFGMWYKIFREYDITQYDRVGLVNDSCILFNKLDFYFDWLDKQDIDYSGLTDCELIKYHIQSYFLIINKKAIPDVLKYFKANGIILDFLQLISTYEVGLSAYLLNAGMNVAVYYSFKNDKSAENPSWIKAKSLIKAGYPLVKKKIIMRNYATADWKGLVANGFDPYPNHYIRLIKRAAPNTNIKALLSDLALQKPFKEEVTFYAIAIFSKTYGICKKLLRPIRRALWLAFVAKKKDK